MYNMQKTPTDVSEYQCNVYSFTLAPVTTKSCTIDIKVAERTVKGKKGVSRCQLGTESGTCETTYQASQMCCVIGNLDDFFKMENEELTTTSKEVEDVSSSCDGSQEKIQKSKETDDKSTTGLSTARSIAGFDDYYEPDVVCYDEPMIGYNEPVMFCEPAPIFAPTFSFGFGCSRPAVVEEEVVVHHRPNYVQSTPSVVYQQPPQQVVVQQPQQSRVVYQPQQSRVVTSRPRRKSMCNCC
ncbi:hypothetical protein M3Y98_01016800 [Aphelenchoides besseyi]|nr:hypothetical protein M3Y98_01016800 [Aphelenchoides besseyi]